MKHIIAVFVLLLATAASAQNLRWTGFQLYEENDVFAYGHTSDKFYTQGLRMTRTLDPNTNPKWLGDLSTLLCTRCSWKPAPVLHVGIGQSIYTPSSIVRPGPQPFDRPWAGWLYASAILHQTEANTFTPTIQQMFEIDLGVIGQGAGAHRAQADFHKIINSPDPLGWQNQIRNQPGLNVTYQRNRRRGSQTADVVWHYDGSVGNVFAHAGTGAMVRAGHNITGFPLNPLVNTVSGTLVRPSFEWYFFGGIDARAIAQNIFIRGGSSRIEQKPFVYDQRVGLSARLNSFRFTYNYVRRSREFTSPVRFPGNHDFGSFALAWEPALKVD